MRFAKTQTIVMTNQKGGCGKTSSTVSLAAAFAHLGYSVCVVDTDPQCNTTQNFGIIPNDLIAESKFTLVDAYMKKRPARSIEIDFGNRFTGNGGDLTLIPGHPGLASVTPRLEADVQAEIASEEASILDADDIRHEHRNRLRESLKSLHGKHDLIIVDTPPNLGFLMTTSLICADWYIIPVFASGYDLNGLETLMRTIKKIRSNYNPEIKLAGVLQGNFDRSTKLDAQVYDQLKKTFGEQLVFNTTIGRSVRFRESTFSSKTIFEFDNAEQQAGQFVELVKEMLNRAKKGASNPLPKVEKHSGNAGKEVVANV